MFSRRFTQAPVEQPVVDDAADAGYAFEMPPKPGRSYSTTSSSSIGRPSPVIRTGSPRSDSYFSPGSPVTATRQGPANGAARVGSPVSKKEGWDEVDKLGYIHSLKVALLQQLMSDPRRSSTFLSSPLASPAITSPSGSRLTFNFANKSADWPAKSPPPVPPTPPSPEAPSVITRRKSSFALGKKKDDVLKLPKEFLVEFWGTLADEQGDEGWHNAVGSFLGAIKKGTKTPSGLNLREIPILLDTFTQSIPSLCPAHVHQTHFLQLLYNSLPRSSHFSPIARTQNDKDRDLLFRLRAEVQTYMLQSSPNGGDDLVSNGFHSPKPPPSPIGLGRSSSSHSGVNEIKRKPSPMWFGDEMVDTVGMVWGVTKDNIDKDSEIVRRAGPLESIYLDELRGTLSFLSSMPSPTASQRNRQQHLRAQISQVLQAFPDLINGTTEPGQSHYAPTSFFAPPRQNEVFARLAERASAAGHGSKTRDLVEKCREVWGISSQREKEKEVEGIAQRWLDAIGSSGEAEWGTHLAGGIKDLYAGSMSTDVPVALRPVMDQLTMMLNTSAISIFPSTDLPPPRPPPSLLPVLSAGATAFFAQQHFKATVENIGDELKGMAVGEYVMAAEQFGGVHRDSTEGLEKLARWIEKEVSNIRRSWNDGVPGHFNPAAIVLSRQLPLFCAELQSLAQPSGSADMFSLYEITGRLVAIWDEICPGQEHGLELDAFFEPHVMAWLRDTETNTTQEWVSRAVGMDSWVPEGENKHSQSVIDLFEFIREAAKVVLHDLPLSEYKRAIYLIDLSKTVSVSTSQYASTVSALFAADMTPAKAGTPTGDIANKLEGKFGGKAGSWLAKGQQAVKSLEKKKVDGFVIPPAACVKLTDMGAAQVCLEDLVFALEAEETARIVKEHKLPNGPPERQRNVFMVSVMRGEGILGRGSKGADGFVVVTDKETGERLLKTRTILGQEDPKWEQSLEISVGRVKVLELAVFDRTLVGKHDPIGSTTFRLDPKSFTDQSTRDVVLPLSPRGTVHLRISMEGGEKHDVAYHLSSASRALGRAEKDMIREIVEKMAEFIKTVLSVSTLATVTKPLKDKKKPRTALSETEIEQSLGPLFEYLNENFGVFSVTLTTPTRMSLMLALWHRTVDILISLLVPPLSDRPYTSKDVVGSMEIDIVFKWLQLIKAFFNASEGGVEHGVSASQLSLGNYKDLVMLGQYLDLPTAALKDRCSAAVKTASSRSAGAANGSLVNGMGGLSVGAGAGTADKDRMAEILLRIARTRPDMNDFLSQQIAMLTKARVDRQAGLL